LEEILSFRKKALQEAPSSDSEQSDEFDDDQSQQDIDD